MKELLAHRGFRRLAGAWTFSNIGDSALYLMAAVWVKDLTGSDSAAGLVFFALGVPVLLAPLAGQLADRVSRRRLVVVANLVVAGLTLTLLTVRSAADVWLVYAVIVVYGAFGYVGSAAQSGLLKDLLPEELLGRANGVLSTIDQGLRIATPLIGAALYALWGAGAVAVLTAVVLVVAAGIMATLRLTETPPTPPGEREGFLRELTAGVRHLRVTPPLGRLTVISAIALGATGLANSTSFALIDRGLGLDTEFFGLLASAQGAGSILAGLTVGWLIARVGERRTLGTGLVVFALASVPLVAVVQLRDLLGAGAGAAALVLYALAGVGVVWWVVGYSTVRIRMTPAALQGRTSAAANVALNGSQSAVTALGAAAILVLDFRLLIGVMSVVILVCGVLAVRGRTTAVEAGGDTARGLA